MGGDFDLPVEVEDAVVQVMTYLIENETAALIVPSRFLAQLHPHFREVMQLLAIQAADEARHIEVFTRRALLKAHELGLSTAGGQASLQRCSTSPTSRSHRSCSRCSAKAASSRCCGSCAIRARSRDSEVCRLAAQDEARHVAFGLAHLREHIKAEPNVRGILASAVRRRNDALRHTTGLNFGSI